MVLSRICHRHGGVILLTITVLTQFVLVRSEDQVCCVDGFRKSDNTSALRFYECQNYLWRLLDCPADEIYSEVLSVCVTAEIMSTMESQTDKTETSTDKLPEQLKDPGWLFDNEKEYKTGDKEHKVDESANLSAKNETSSEELPEQYNEFGDSNENGVKKKTDEDSEEKLVLKAIADDGESVKIQSYDKPIIWTSEPIVIKKATKSKANWTTTVLNGVAQYTDISFYQSQGRSFMFRVPGGLPAEQHRVIPWIRANAHNYPQIDIPYFPDQEQTTTGPPDGLPARCGTKFLKKLSGGKATPIEENPWQVAVLRSPEESYICGGAVITRRHVLSAAHCFKRRGRRYGRNDILLRVGDYDKEVREESQVDYTVHQLLIHEGYHEKRHLNDIALLSTSEDIPFSSNIYPICLPSSYTTYDPGLKCTVSGFGQVETEDVPTRYLRSGEVTIVSSDECRRKTIFARGVPQQIFCAEDPTQSGVDTCLGDSGGPFACNHNGSFYLFGITAFGSYPCGQDVPSFYTNVSYYRTWILDSIINRKPTKL